MLELAEGFLEGGELADEDVGLVDLVRHHHQILVGGEAEDVRDGVGGQAAARGVARVDHDDGADVGAVALSIGVGVLDGGHVRGPATGLVEVVGHAPRVQQGQGGGVERVLRDGYQDACFWFRADDVHKRVHPRARARRQKDGGGVRGEAIALLDELGHGVADPGGALGLRVCAHGFYFGQEPFGAVDDIGGVVEGGLQGGFVGEEGGVLEDGEDLAEEGDGFLVELLRVADVGGDDGVEGEGLVGVGGRSGRVVGGF